MSADGSPVTLSGVTAVNVFAAIYFCFNLPLSTIFFYKCYKAYAAVKEVFPADKIVPLPLKVATEL